MSNDYLLLFLAGLLAGVALTLEVLLAPDAVRAFRHIVRYVRLGKVSG